MGAEASYDEIGRAYSATRRTDPTIAAAIWSALGEAETVLNVGAGAGAYEPPDREVVAVEPSEVMIAQRPARAAPVVRAPAEALPLADDSVDAAMAVLTDHHWSDRARALAELRRVTRRRIVLFNADPAQAERFWMTTEYLPGFLGLIPRRLRRPGAWRAEFERALGTEVRIEPVPIPHDCRDGFYGAYWRRPSAYLQARVRTGISVFARLERSEVERGLERLAHDLQKGIWYERHAELRELDALDLGYALVVAEI
ncbi:MAG: class I SAM-dependent methyltransferase [Actinobacteria bacterium]|nr:MAG: class I SAM-dependent methyltransferase [Actinomycetota bacterium]